METAIAVLIMLNGYHLKFLRHLIKCGVRFLIVGGQARNLLFGTHTKDLDVWVDLSDSNRPVLDDALIAWAEEHPSHTRLSWTTPLQLRPRVQIKFPDQYAMYMSESNEIVEIKLEDGIDVLTSLSGLDFNECMDRSIVHRTSVGEVRHLCASDLDAPDRTRKLMGDNSGS